MATSPSKKFRELNNLSQPGLIELLHDELGLTVSKTMVSRWDNGKTAVPPEVLAFMESGTVATPEPTGDGAGPGASATAPGGEDAPPGSFSDQAGDPAKVKPLSVSSQAYDKACAELWQMIGFGVTIAGKGLKNAPVERDGTIIQAHSQALGAAYGKLAEQNETFRRLIIGMTQGGAWVEVAGVTVLLAQAIATNHRDYNAWARDQQRDNVPPAPPDVDDAEQPRAA